MCKSIEHLFARLEYITEPPTAEEFAAMDADKSSLIPLLLTEVNNFSQAPDVIEEKGEAYIRHVLAPFLLAYYREKAAYPKIIKLISNEGSQVVQLTGEVFLEAIGRILASVFDGRLSLIQSVVENEKLNPWVRAGALDSFMVLWKEGVLSRDEVLAYLEKLLTGNLEAKPSYVWDAVALIAYDLHPQEIEKPLRKAIENKLIEPVVLSETLLDDCLSQPFHSVLKQKENIVDGYIKSPTIELSWWLYPDRKTLKKGKDYELLDVPIVDKDVIPGERISPMGWRSATVVRAGEKLGRNEPCLCGSGKKYKKCCLNS